MDAKMLEQLQKIEYSRPVIHIEVKFQNTNFEVKSIISLN